MFTWLADTLVYRLLGLAPGTHLASALHFFVFDTVKILVMLAAIIFLVSLVRSFFPPEKTRALLSRRHQYVGNILAALLGIVTPFCSCSAVPMFIGFVESGVPLGVTFSFLISSPMVNEVALVMLWGMFGWKVALLYMATGVTVAIVGGLALGHLHLEGQVEDFVYEIRLGEAAGRTRLSWRDRLHYAGDYVRDILRRVWPFVVIGIAVGGFIHGYAPQNFLVRYAGPGNLFAVPVAVAVGVPLYSNAAGTIPIVHALMEKGMAMGTALAFMMAVTALSLPEMIILRRVLKPKLIAIFVGIIALAIIATGYLFNAVL
ncbi:MAG TPA: permease [Firmicutes bacterium]|nr:permease [Bacillota bacterium]